jgi:hypothetical protein
MMPGIASIKTLKIAFFNVNVIVLCFMLFIRTFTGSARSKIIAEDFIMDPWLP